MNTHPGEADDSSRGSGPDQTSTPSPDGTHRGQSGSNQRLRFHKPSGDGTATQTNASIGEV